MSVAVTAIVSAVIGLALSSLGKSLREVLPLVVPVILTAVLFNGSLVQLVSKWGLQQISWFVPARWGFAASASTANLRRVDSLAADAVTWTHYSGWWVFDMGMLVLFGAIAAGFTLYRLRSPLGEAARPPIASRRKLLNPRAEAGPRRGRHGSHGRGKSRSTTCWSALFAATRTAH